MLDGLSANFYPRSEWERSHAVVRALSPPIFAPSPHIGGHRGRPAPASAHRIASMAIPTPVEQEAVRRLDGRHRTVPRPHSPDCRRPPTPPPPARSKASTGAGQRPHRQRQPGRWRWLATDPNDVAFNVYRGGTKVNSSPRSPARRTTSTPAPRTRPTTRCARSWAASSRPTPCTRSSSAPATRTCRSPRRPAAPPRTASPYTYEANDASVGDLDGDGALDFVLKWQPDQRQGQLPVRLHRQHDRRRRQARRHPPVAHRPGPQHPLRRALHAVPGVRLRRRRQGRGRHEDRRRHGRRNRRGHRQLLGRPPQLQRATCCPAPST